MNAATAAKKGNPIFLVDCITDLTILHSCQMLPIHDTEKIIHCIVGW